MNLEVLEGGVGFGQFLDPTPKFVWRPPRVKMKEKVVPANAISTKSTSVTHLILVIRFLLFSLGEYNYCKQNISVDDIYAFAADTTKSNEKLRPLWG